MFCFAMNGADLLVFLNLRATIGQTLELFKFSLNG